MRIFSRITFFIVILICLPECETGWAGEYESALSGMHTWNATDSIQEIDVQVVYYLEKNGWPLPDWRERVEYHMRRVQEFHHREFTGQSRMEYTLLPKPFLASATAEGFPGDDVNQFYWTIINEVWHSGKIHFQPNRFPILLVFANVNFSPGYDDWTRVCHPERCLFPSNHDQCAGHVTGEGEDRPGSRCGGARSVFWPEQHIGLSLVTADGWKVPIKGTDCVVYHEGIGHAVGLPHPEPIDNSVMGLAQYVDSLQKTWIDEDQKRKLGWTPEPIDHDPLFSSLSVSHRPSNPSASAPVEIVAELPSRFEIVSAELRVQTGLFNPFEMISESRRESGEGIHRWSWTLPPVAKDHCVGYRVTVKTKDGLEETIWDYYKVRE